MATHIEVPGGQAYEYQQQLEINAEKATPGKDTIIATEEVPEDDVRPAHRTHYATAFFDLFISILPLYFIVFAIVSKVRDESPASSVANMAILRMAALNPTLFPIVFTLIMARLLKSIANWRLERGATVGLIQQLLGSRSLVNSVITPVKLRTSTFLAPLLVLAWILNPLGGQTSLRVVSRESKYTPEDRSFYYLNLDTTTFKPYFGSQGIGNTLETVMTVFDSALSSPAWSKNGTQDLFGNVHIPMLEEVANDRAVGHDGWYSTSKLNLSRQETALLHLLDVDVGFKQPINSALLGMPFARGNNGTAISTADSASDDGGDGGTQKLEQIKQDLFGDEILNTRSLFSVETSYMYANCTVKRLSATRLDLDGEDKKSSWTNGTVFASNDQGLTIAYAPEHNYNATTPRSLRVQSWLPITGEESSIDDNGGESQLTNGVISEGKCELTTTYVEAEVYCPSNGNCTVSRIRPSNRQNPSSSLTVLDGITMKLDDHSPFTLEDTWNYTDVAYRREVARHYFDAFVNTTGGASSRNEEQLTPLESFFAAPASPYKQTWSNDQRPIDEVGDALFSQRMTQLLNTFWLAGVAPISLISGFNATALTEGSSPDDVEFDGMIVKTPGRIFNETMVLKCHMAFFIPLLIISFALFVAGLVTAYLDFYRRGPDVLDDFVNSLRHSPYVHVEQGPTMEDGQEKARRLRQTVIMMGDVQPDDRHGYVAIGTPSERQPVERLSHKRYYR